MIKQFFKKVLISYLIIICCIYTPTAQAAGWSFGGFNFGNGSLNITKNGVKITTAPVSTAPITSNLGSKILSGALRGASFLGALSMVIGIAEDAVDWVLDPANNSIKYKRKIDANTYDYKSSVSGKTYPTPEQACDYLSVVNNGAGIPGVTFSHVDLENGLCYYNRDGELLNWSMFEKVTPKPTTQYASIPIPTVAQQILNNAKSGDTNAQADVTSAVNELVNSGAYDTPINQAIQDAIKSGALPKDTDTDTNTDTNNPTNPQIDTSSITAAIQSLASSFASAISNAFNGITSVINTSIDKLLNKQDQIQGEVVNVGSKVEGVGGKVVGVGDKVDNVGGKVVGVGDAVKDVGGKVVGLNDSVDKVGDKVVGVGDKVTATGDKVTDAVTGVGDKVTGVGADVRGVGDKVVGVGDKVDAAGEKTAEAIKEQTKEITKKMDETKPKDFELPAFCSWASKVCDFIDWYKKDPQDEANDEIAINEKPNPPFDIDTLALKPYISLPSECPANPAWNFMGGQIVLPLNIVCDGFSMASWLVMAFAWLRGLVIVGSTFKG